MAAIGKWLELAKKVLALWGQKSASLPGWLKVTGWIALLYYLADAAYGYLRTGKMADWIVALPDTLVQLAQWIGSFFGAAGEKADTAGAQEAAASVAAASVSAATYQPLLEWVTAVLLDGLAALGLPVGGLRDLLLKAADWIDGVLTVTITEIPGFTAWLKSLEGSWNGLHTIVESALPVLSQLPVMLLLVVVAAELERRVAKWTTPDAKRAPATA